jgi:hypothetical protein
MNSIQQYRTIFYGSCIAYILFLMIMIRIVSASILSKISKPLTILFESVTYIFLIFIIIACIMTLRNPHISVWQYIKVAMHGVFICLFTFVNIIFFMMITSPSMCMDGQGQGSNRGAFSLIQTNPGLFVLYIILLIIVILCLLFADHTSIPKQYRMMMLTVSLIIVIYFMKTIDISTKVGDFLSTCYMLLAIYIGYYMFTILTRS